MKIKKYSSEKNGATFSKKALSYAAMTGAFLAVAGQSDGQIIYTDVNPDDTVMSAGPNMYDFFPIDFDNDGVVDIVVQHNIQPNGTTKICWVGTFSQITTSSVPVTMVNRANRIPGTLNINGTRTYLYPSVFNQGDMISSANSMFHSFNEGFFKSEMTLNWISTGQYGQWYGMAGFMGMEFIGGTDIHYGWVDLDVDSAASRVIVKGYAYEATPSMGIHAGDIGVGVPNEISKNSIGFVITNNPASANGPSFAVFASDKPQDCKLEIMNNLGEVLTTQVSKANAGANTVRLNLNGIASGNYFVKMTLGDKINYKRLMIAER